MKSLFKTIIKIASFFVVFPLLCIFKFLDFLYNDDKTFQAFSHLFSLLPGLPGNYLRAQFYRYSLKSCSDDCCIEFGTILHQKDIEIGKRVYIGPNCSIGLCRIEDDVMLGSNVDIISGKNQHNFDRIDIPMREQGGHFEKIVIGEDSWLGNSSVVMANVGKKAIVAAGSVVVNNVEPYHIVGGNPAKFLKSRLSEEKVKKK